MTVSPALCLPPPDWPAIVRETSFLFWDRPPEWQMPQELDVFPVASDPVVCLSFGSMSLDLGHGFDALYR